MHCLVCGKETDGIKQSNGSWIPPPCWTGPCAVLYLSCDSSDGFVLMEGTQATLDSVALVSGKVEYIRFVFRKITSVKPKTAATC